MGIHGLMKLLSEECPGCIKEYELENYTGRKIAIDASMAMYQFLVAVRSNGPGQAATQLTNEDGNVTSHIQGMFNRTIKMMVSGIKPVYIFDGKPPQMKSGELAKRIAKRAKAENDLAAAQAAEELEDVDKFSRRLVKVTRQHNEECKQLLRLMGVPVLTAPCEAEAQCAELARKNKVYATATEDMDALTFRTPKLIRKLTFSQVKGKDKQFIVELDFESVLKGLELTYEQFVDLCILCGCDYCGSIKGVGPKTALKLIRTHKNIENIVTLYMADPKHKSDVPYDWLPQKISKKLLDKIQENNEKENNDEPGENDEDVVDDIELKDNVNVNDTKEVDKIEENSNITLDNDEVNKQLITTTTTTMNNEMTLVEELLENDNDDEYEIIPPLFVQARQLFINCDVTPAEDIELKWELPDEAGLTDFLVNNMQFNPERVANGIKKLQEAQPKKAQTRMDSFFTTVNIDSNNNNNKQNIAKRKLEESKNNKKGNKFNPKRR